MCIDRQSSAVPLKGAGLASATRSWSGAIRCAGASLGVASSSVERGAVLDLWLRDGSSCLPVIGSPAPLDLNQTTSYTVLPPGPVVLRGLRVPEATYLVPVLATVSATRFVAYVSEGSVLSVGPHHSSSLSVSFYLCSSMSDDAYSSSPVCEELHPSSLKLIPNPSPEKPFPVPHEGIDESEGVVIFNAALPEL